MAAIWAIITKFLGGLSTTTWLVAGGVLAFAGWTWLVYDAGYDKADARWVSKALEAQIARLELEATVREEADRREQQYTKELLDENNQQQRKIDDYINQLKNRPDKCLLGPDADSLQ